LNNNDSDPIIDVKVLSALEVVDLANEVGAVSRGPFNPTADFSTESTEAQHLFAALCPELESAVVEVLRCVARMRRSR
jgi:hypothetical protein